MAIRQLSDEEKKICDISINRLKKRNRQLQFYIKKSRLELNEGLKITYEKTRDELEGALNEFQGEFNKNKEQIDILYNQITNGVGEKKEAINIAVQ